MATAETFPPISPGATRAALFIRVGRTMIMAATYLVLAWSLSQAVRGRSAWAVPLGLLAFTALFIHLSDSPLLPRWLLLNRLTVHISNWKGCAFSIVFGVWYALLVGPGSSTRYFIHPATWYTVEEANGWMIASLLYEEHPRRALIEPGKRPGSINEPSGGEGIGIYDREFVKQHQEMNGQIVPVVLSQPWSFGAPTENGWSLHSVGEFHISEFNYSWGDSSTVKSLQEWSPVAPRYILTEAQAERALGRELP